MIYICISNCFRNIIIIFILRFLDRKFIIIMESICANLQTLADLSSGIRITGNICYENSQYFLELLSKNALWSTYYSPADTMATSDIHAIQNSF